ncbi:hypothetical protein G6F43_001985 [Rhizopus delemar]|nr:hypothetical protein G6F43_001985 [Rhizopus delemar]
MGLVPNSTATNWIREFQKWAPDMSVVPFFGLGASRKLALDNEIFDKHMNLKCHAVVATYESIQESTKLQNIFWPVMIVDESQRLKNDESQLFKALNRFNKDQSILLTGTPLQNNLKELFNIMNFIRPADFHGTQAEDYEDMTREQVEELHSRLRPYFLRRTKEEILKTLPPKHEIIVPLSMTPLQKEVYKSCLSRDIESILGTTTYKRSKGLTSIFMNLRKTLNHPYLIDGVETHQPTAEATQRAMIDACEKLKFFHQMLPKLRSQGHRVLIFSTMTRALDVLDDYLTYEDIGFARLDGSDSERERVRNIDAFNAPNSKLDVFLLSTRAGGVGINLATADTVIIWDSDFNPYADLQAIGRAHRIGQTKMVLIYRFMTRLSVEERILQIGRKKMALEHVVVEKMSSEEDTIEDIESILRFGAQALFDNDDSADISYDSAAIDRLLDRDQYKAVAEAQKEKDIAEAQDQKGGLSFAYAKVWKTDGTSEELTETAADEAAQADFWEKFLQSKQEEVERKKAEKKLHDMNLGRGARKRAQVSYSEKLYGDADSGRQKKSKSKEIRKDEDDEYAFIESEDEEVNEITGEEGTNTEGGPNEIVVEGALNMPEQLSTLKFKKSTVQRSKKGTNQRSQNSSATKRMRMTESMPLPPAQTSNLNETLIPKVSAAFLEQMNLALRTIFERHCRLVQDYLIVCGKERVPKDFYEANIKRGIAHLVNNLRIEVETAINREQQHLQSTGTPLEALSAYSRTKYEIFEKSIEGALTQFELWKNYNEPLLISMGTREYMFMEKKYVQTQSNQNQQLPSSNMHSIDQSSVPHDSHNIAQSHASPQPQSMQSCLSNSPAMNQPLGQSGLQSHSPSQQQPIQYNGPPSISQSIAASGSSPQSQPMQLQYSNQPKINQSPGPSGSQSQHPSQLPQPAQQQYSSPSTVNQSLGPSSSQSQHIQLTHPIYSNLPGINQSPGPSGSQHIQLHFNGQPIMSQSSSQPLRFNSPSSTDQSSGDFQSKSVPSQFSAPSSVHQHSGLSQSQSVQLQSDKHPSTSQSSGSSEPQPMQLKFSSTPEGKASPIPSGSQPMYNTFQAVKPRAPPPQSQTIQAYFAKAPNTNMLPRPSESQPSQDTHSPIQPHSQSQSQPVQSQYSIHPQSYK